MADPERERALLRDRLLGWGLAADPIYPGLDVGRDLVLTGGPNGTDFGRVRGIDCLSQDLKVAYTTMLGGDVFNTDFGFDGLRAFVEETNAALLRERIRVSVIQVLRKDPRVRRILDVRLEREYVDRETQDVVSRLNAKVGFETVTGDQAVADLGTGVLNG